MKDRGRLVRISNWLAGLVAVAVTVSVPAGYYAISYEHEVGSLEAAAEINGHIVSGFINANPEMWQFEQMRLEEILKRRPHSGQKETRRVVDLQHRVIAESADELDPPLIRRSYDLKDSGVTVAKVEICCSLLPILVNTALVGGLGMVLGVIVFSILRVLPFRAVILAEKALRESEERFRKIFEMSPLGMATIGTDFHFIAVNDMLCKMTGYSAAELTDLTLSDITHPNDLPFFMQEIPKVIDLEVSDSVVEGRYLRNGGEPFWVNLTVSLISAESSLASPYLLVITKDVTAQRNLEIQLRQSQKMEAVGQLAGGIAHDFNNVLTAIIGYASVLQMKMDPVNPAQYFARQILAAADKAAKLTTGLLAFSRKQAIQPHHIDLNDVVNNVKGLLGRIFTVEIEVRTVFCDRELIVMADPVQIDQILLNMAANARDAMPKHGVFTVSVQAVEITEEYVGTHGRGPAGSYALLEVSDTGSGIGDADHARIFEPFFTTKPVGEGTGLGLSVIYGIVQQHHGFISVRSKLGQGTTFQVYLPLITGNGVCNETIEVSQTALEGSETILVVEDNQEVRALIKEVVEHFGYRILTAVDGLDAVEVLRTTDEKVDLVLLDVVMPRMSGLEALDEIQRICPEVKVLFTSGYTADVLSRKGYCVDDYHFLAKPTHPTVLLQKMREILQAS